jgi:SAM-dependent methyltransferase
MALERLEVWKMDSRDYASLYDAYYYAHDCGRPYQRDKLWLDQFDNIAGHIVAGIGPRTVLDAGCAMGFLVEGLRKRGVECYGVDISDYAIANVHESVRPYCWVGSICDPFPQKYDLIVCIEILEHMPPSEAQTAIANLCRHTDDVLFSSTPFDYKEVTHLNVQPPEHWAELFARQGFLRDVDFDATFIVPWAVRFRRKADALPRAVRDYERRFWLMWQENVDLRRLSVDVRQHVADGECAREVANSAVAEATELRADVDWMKYHIQRHTRRNWADRLHTAINRFNRTGLLQRRAVRRLPPLTEPIAQTFVAEHDHLSAVSVLVESRLELAIHPLMVILAHTGGEGETVIQRTLRPREMPPMGPITLRFPPISQSKGQAYRLSFQTPYPVSEDGHLPYLWGYRRSCRQASDLCRGGQQLPGELVMATSYGAPDNSTDDQWTPVCWSPRSSFDPLTWLDFLFSRLFSSHPV